MTQQPKSVTESVGRDIALGLSDDELQTKYQFANPSLKAWRLDPKVAEAVNTYRNDPEVISLGSQIIQAKTEFEYLINNQNDSVKAAVMNAISALYKQHTIR